MFEQLPSDSRMPNAERLTLFLTEDLHKRMEWQVAETSADQITVNVFTHLIWPDPVDHPQAKVELNQHIKATVVLELVQPGYVKLQRRTRKPLRQGTPVLAPSRRTCGDGSHRQRHCVSSKTKKRPAAGIAAGRWRTQPINYSATLDVPK